MHLYICEYRYLSTYIGHIQTHTHTYIVVLNKTWQQWQFTTTGNHRAATCFVAILRKTLSFSIYVCVCVLYFRILNSLYLQLVNSANKFSKFFHAERSLWPLLFQQFHLVFITFFFFFLFFVHRNECLCL